MSEEQTIVKYAEKAGQLNDGKKITLEGVVKGDIIANEDGKEDFDGKDDIIIKTEFDEKADITKTKISIEEPSLKEGIQATEKIGELLWKIKDEIENKLGKTEIATSAEKLSKGKNISLVGNVTGTVVFDGSKDVEIKTEIAGGDIKDTVVSFTESSIREEIQSGERTSIIVGKIKKWFKDLQEQVNNKLGKNDKAKDSEKLDGKLASEYAPIENPTFSKDIEVKGILKTYQRKIEPSQKITRQSINDDITYTHVCNLSANSNGTIYLYCDGAYVDEIIEIKVLGGNSINNKIEVKASKHAKMYGITEVYLYANTNYFGSEMSIYVQFKQLGKHINSIHLLYGDILHHNPIINKLSFVKSLPRDKVLLDSIKITSEKGIYTNIEQTALTPAVADKSTKVATTEFVYEILKAYKEGRLNL